MRPLDTMALSRVAIAFDLYGTLLSTESIAKRLADLVGDDKADSVAALWRRYQLEYTWRMNSMESYRPFDQLTRLALLHALAEHSLTLSDADLSSLMASYDSLSVFPDVVPALTLLDSTSARPRADAFVFTNGTAAMVSASVHGAGSALAPHAALFRELVTVEETRAFKPAPRVYRHLVAKAGKTVGEIGDGEVWLVSGNPFDVVGARAAGLRAAWVDRKGGHHGNGGWSDRLGVGMGTAHEMPDLEPDLIVGGVEEAVRGILAWVEKKGSVHE